MRDKVTRQWPQTTTSEEKGEPNRGPSAYQHNFTVFKVKYKCMIYIVHFSIIIQELCESRGGRPGLSVLTSLLVSVDVKLY